ncbi:M48 family metallopeptidase [Candidatus Pelagadaptatus aseana]|uniref:M48 family metallopeptidase n=1 Tax=Candidatus Pelagadaptatus aseana TaxID=3120508 RepID=UPI003C6F8385
MGRFEGRWYDGSSSRQQVCTLQISERGDMQVVADDDSLPLHQDQWLNVKLSSRLGNTPRYFEFADGQKFETLDNDGVDALIEQLRAEGISHPASAMAKLLHLMESKIRYGLLALLVVIAVGTWSTVYGVPAVSKWIAYQLPPDVLSLASEQTMELLDSSVFEASTLEPEVSDRVLQHFQPALDHYADLNVRVLFRDGAGMGANAFALPDGTIVFTDQMVRLAQHDDQLLAVLAHEIGHVYYRHGMRSLVQNSMLAFMLLMMSGDVGATAEIFLALPIFLTEMAYSRNYERESDDFALSYLLEHNIDKSSFPDLMSRLQLFSICMQSPDGSCADPEAEVDAEAAYRQFEQGCLHKVLAGEIEAPTNMGESWGDYLSSHPATEERLLKFRDE